jgi:capsular polysaccharide biosynthesis protein
MEKENDYSREPQELPINKEDSSDGLSFKDILLIIRKHLIAIIIFLVVGGVGGEVFNLVEKKSYEATATMIVSPDSTGSSSDLSEYQYSNYISKTYVAFIEQDVVMDQVSSTIKSEKGYTISNKDLCENTTTGLVDSSLVISIGYTSDNAAKSQYIANVIANKAFSVSNLEYEDGSPRFKLLYGNISVLSEAKEGKKVSHTLRNIGIGFAVGLVLAIVYVVVREMTNTKFKSSEEVEKLLGTPVLGLIPYYSNDTKKEGK